MLFLIYKAGVGAIEILIVYQIVTERYLQLGLRQHEKTFTPMRLA